jgi:hypothetical protein
VGRVAPVPRPPQFKALASILAVVAFLALPSAAGAALAYVKEQGKFRVYVAEDNGKGARPVGDGRYPHVSPDGKFVVYRGESPGSGEAMELYSVATGKTTTLLGEWDEGEQVAWSPDSGTVAAVSGPVSEPGRPQQLIVIEVETGKVQNVAKGYPAGISFSPDGTEIVYGLARKSAYPLPADVYRYSIGGGRPVALTHDHDGERPIWGPDHQIVFEKRVSAKNHSEVKSELFLMDEDGRRVRRLTHSPTAPEGGAIFPTAWASGFDQLLAQYVSHSADYAVAVNARTGAERTIAEHAPPPGFVGAALSADGKAVLGSVGNFPRQEIVAVPFAGGGPKVLATDASEPSWGG